VADGGRWQGGEVHFDDAEEFARELDAFISKGALRLRGEALPAPLEPFEFALAAPDGAPVKLKGMIVAVTGGIALVQILDFSQAIPGELRRRITARPIGPPPAAAPPELETVSPVDGPLPVLPAGPLPALLTAAGSLPPVGQPPRPPGRETVPPPTGSTATIPPGEAFDAVVDWATPPPPQTGVFALQSPATLVALTGSLVNPTGLRGLATLPLGPVAAVRDLDTVSTVGLLRYLGARRASGDLVLRGAGQGERRLAVDRGAYLLSPQEREGLRVVFQWPTGQYQFEPGTPTRPPHRLPVSAWRLVLDGVRLIIREAKADEVLAQLDRHKAVRLSAAFAERARSLDLQPAEERITKRDFDGRLTLADLARLGALSELSLYRLTLLLHVLGLVELVDVAADAAAPKTDDVRAFYERIVGTDLFTALGCHWSDPPAQIDAGLADMRKRFGPHSDAARSSPEYAARLIELAERAHRRLKERTGRRLHRDELGVDVRHAAEHLVQQVPIARSRGELPRAFELMNAACDLVDRSDWERLRHEISVLLPSRGPGRP
jgi:hypothetical protein